MSTKKKMSEQDKKEWCELCAYVEREILRYDKNQHMQKDAVLRLRGITRGQVVANNKVKNNGNYSYAVVLNTFKYCKNKILRALSNKDFESEGAEMAYIAAIIRNNINLIYSRMQEVDKSKEKIDKVDTNIMTHKRAEYRKRQDRNPNKKFEDMW